MKKHMALFLILIWTLIWALCVAPALAEPEALTISGGVYYDVMNFEEKHPEIAVNQLEEWPDATEMIRRITSQDDSVDIYAMNADFSFLSIKNKGLAEPLDGSEAVMQSAQGLDKSVLDAITDGNGRIIAWPDELELWTIRVNEELWRKFWPDTPLPETFSELLDAWIDWEDRVAVDYPGVGFIGYEFDYAAQVRAFITLFVRQHDDGDEPDLHNAALREVLEKLETVRDRRIERSRPVGGENDPQLDMNGATGAASVYSRSLDFAMGEQDGDNDGPVWPMSRLDRVYGCRRTSTALPLTFDKNDVRYTDARMSVCFINPYSQHKDAALMLIEQIAGMDRGDLRLYYAVHPDYNEPHVRDDYEEYRAFNEQRRAEYVQALEDAKKKDEDTTELEAWVKYYDDWLNWEYAAYDVLPQTIMNYRAQIAAAPLNLHIASPYLSAAGAEGEMMATLCSRYAAGTISLDQLLDELQSAMSMITRENA